MDEAIRHAVTLANRAYGLAFDEVNFTHSARVAGLWMQQMSSPHLVTSSEGYSVLMVLRMFLAPASALVE